MASRSRCRTEPRPASRPSRRCACATVRSRRVNCGTNRSVMLSSSDSAGMIRPNRYTTLSEVITSVTHTNHSTTAASSTPEAQP